MATIGFLKVSTQSQWATIEGVQAEHARSRLDGTPVSRAVTGDLVS